MSDVMTFPPSYHLRTLRQFLEAERLARLQRKPRDRFTGDVDLAMDSLRALEALLGEGAA